MLLQRLRNARLLWPTLAALAGLAVLIGLGTWQMERKRLKEDLLATISSRVHADPVPLSAVLGRAGEQGESTPDYTHVAVTGRFLHDKERYLYAPTPGGLGWHVYTPLETPDGKLVWINRGFVPDARKAPETRPEGQVAGTVEVRGLVRRPSGPGAFAARNDPDRNVWYWPDLDAMTASAFPGSGAIGRTVPLFVEADAQPAPPGGLPKGGATRLSLPNRHLEYALTWYGLAATLVGVYFFFAISRLRGAA